MGINHCGLSICTAPSTGRIFSHGYLDHVYLTREAGAVSEQYVCARSADISGHESDPFATVLLPCGCSNTEQVKRPLVGEKRTTRVDDRMYFRFGIVHPFPSW